MAHRRSTDHASVAVRWFAVAIAVTLVAAACTKDSTERSGDAGGTTQGRYRATIRRTTDPS